MPSRFDASRLNTAWRLLDAWTERDEAPAACAAVGALGGELHLHAAGRRSPHDAAPAADDTIFLIASPTKPITALAVMRLAEEGRLRLSDRAAEFVPEFGTAGKDQIRLSHLLTHTSGLPDMLPENTALRRRHATLNEFLAGICQLTPDFVPGTGVQYQSTGFLVLAEVVRRVAGIPLPEFLNQHVVEPLAMCDTALGMPDAWTKSTSGRIARQNRIAEVRLGPASPPDVDQWGWNSDYWRRLGAPWGGLLSTAPDLARFALALLSLHQGEPGIIQPATLAAMTRNQLLTFPEIPERRRRCTPWGYGWQLHWPNHPHGFGDMLSPAAYGHWGATGTMFWIDPVLHIFAVLLTTAPLAEDRRLHVQFSNAVCGALHG